LSTRVTVPQKWLVEDKGMQLKYDLKISLAKGVKTVFIKSVLYAQNKMYFHQLFFGLINSNAGLLRLRMHLVPVGLKQQ
jgi:hypothetical protein